MASVVNLQTKQIMKHCCFSKQLRGPNSLPDYIHQNNDDNACHEPEEQGETNKKDR
jgi:hypothetical protein